MKPPAGYDTYVRLGLIEAVDAKTLQPGDTVKLVADGRVAFCRVWEADAPIVGTVQEVKPDGTVIVATGETSVRRRLRAKNWRVDTPTISPALQGIVHATFVEELSRVMRPDIDKAAFTRQTYCGYTVVGPDRACVDLEVGTDAPVTCLECLGD